MENSKSTDSNKDGLKNSDFKKLEQRMSKLEDLRNQDVQYVDNFVKNVNDKFKTTSDFVIKQFTGLNKEVNILSTTVKDLLVEFKHFKESIGAKIDSKVKAEVISGFNLKWSSILSNIAVISVCTIIFTFIMSFYIHGVNKMVENQTQGLKREMQTEIGGVKSELGSIKTEIFQRKVDQIWKQMHNKKK